MKGGRGSFDHMLKVAKKKPELQKVIDNIESYTEEDINSLSFPKWIRKHLLNCEENAEEKRNIELEATKMAALMPSISPNERYPKYTAYKYNGSDEYIGDISKFLLEHGDLILDVGDGNIKVNANIVKIDNKGFTKLVKSCEIIGKYNIIEYNEMLFSHIEKSHKLTTPSGTDYSIAGIFARSVKFGK